VHQKPKQLEGVWNKLKKGNKLKRKNTNLLLEQV